MVVWRERVCVVCLGSGGGGETMRRRRDLHELHFWSGWVGEGLRELVWPPGILWLCACRKGGHHAAMYQGGGGLSHTGIVAA